MAKELIIKELEKKFKSEILNTITRNKKRITIKINPASLIMVSQFLLKEKGFRFIIASALHTRKGFEIHYHFSFDQDGLVLNIHVLLDSKKPEIESLSNMLEAANWIEREIHELFGINFLNHPNQEKLLSDGNWAEDVYPYRKEFKNT